MSSTTHDLVFELNDQETRQAGTVSELLSMAGDVFDFGPAPSTMVERAEATLYGGLFAAAMLIAAYGLSFL